jgi:serine/threonine protein kinase
LQWNDFVLQEQIGSGATGRVYRATQKQTDRSVAIKFLRKYLIGNVAAMERFLRESRIVAALTHPGIVAIHGAGRTPGGGLFLVMDLVTGRDLDTLRGERLIAPREAVRWIANGAEAVQFAHERGVIHCDLKPSNLLLDDQGSIRVTDFGLAVQLKELSRDGAPFAGTPAFMAPEQVDPCWGPISPQTDVWGLGGVLFCLIFGQPPHVGENMSELLARVASKMPVQLPTNAPTLASQPVLQLIARCLTKRPKDRTPSARLAIELRAVLAADA